MPAHGTAAHEDAEKTVTGTAADKAKAAAIKAEGGGTAGTVTTDFTGDGYEVTITKTNGSKVEVHLDNVVHRGGRDPAGPACSGPRRPRRLRCTQRRTAPPSGYAPSGAPSGYGPPSGSGAPSGTTTG